MNSQFEQDVKMMPAPKMVLNVPPDNKNAILLHQTKQVYDQLLADKRQKQIAHLLSEKQKYDAECERLAKTDKSRAMEYGVRAQQDLNTLHQGLLDELNALASDYQQNLEKMRQEVMK